MLRLFRERHFSQAFLIWCFSLTWLLFFAHDFFSHSRNTIEDVVAAQSFWLFSRPPRQVDDITIVAIDEASRLEMNLKYPWKRSLSGTLIREIAALAPSVIGLDIVFSGESEAAEDRALAAAVGAHPRTVAGYVLHGEFEDLPFEEVREAASSLGFVNKPHDDGLIRTTRTYARSPEGRIGYALDIQVLLEHLGSADGEVSVDAEGVYRDGLLLAPSPGGVTPLNYIAHPAWFTTVPASDVLGGRANPADFKDRIVLVGATDPILHDEFRTPLGIAPGVTIVANTVVMFMTQRFLNVASPGVNFLIMFLLGIMILLTTGKLRFFTSTLITFSMLCAAYGAFLFLRSLDIQLAYLPILLSGAAAYVIPHLYGYASLHLMGNRLKSVAVTDSWTGFYTRRFFLLLMAEKMKSPEDLSLLVLRIDKFEKLVAKLHFDELRALSSAIGDHVRTRVSRRFRTYSPARLSSSTLAVLIEGAEKEELELFLKVFLAENESREWMAGETLVHLSFRSVLIRTSGGAPGSSSGIVARAETLLDTLNDTLIVREGIEEAASETEADRGGDAMELVMAAWEEKDRELEKALRESMELNKKLNRFNWETLTALARTIDAKSPWTAGHAEEMTKVALKIGRELGIGEKELDDLHHAGLIHDIGKLSTPPHILNKPGKLTPEEMRLVREHPCTGRRILEPIEAYAEIIPIAMQHHERYDGGGYPDGLARDEITLGGRILAVADAYDTLISERPYRPGLPRERVLELIRKGSGTQFDPSVVDALLRVMDGEAHLEGRPRKSQPNPA